MMDEVIVQPGICTLDVIDRASQQPIGIIKSLAVRSEPQEAVVLTLECYIYRGHVESLLRTMGLIQSEQSKQ